MTYFIHARDGASQITLRRATRDAALKKARELEDHGWFDVEIEMDEADEGEVVEAARQSAEAA